MLTNRCFQVLQKEMAVRKRLKFGVKITLQERCSVVDITTSTVPGLINKHLTITVNKSYKTIKSRLNHSNTDENVGNQIHTALVTRYDFKKITINIIILLRIEYEGCELETDYTIHRKNYYRRETAEDN